MLLVGRQHKVKVKIVLSPRYDAFYEEQTGFGVIKLINKSFHRRLAIYERTTHYGGIQFLRNEMQRRQKRWMTTNRTCCSYLALGCCEFSFQMFFSSSTLSSLLLHVSGGRRELVSIQWDQPRGAGDRWLSARHIFHLSIGIIIDAMAWTCMKQAREDCGQLSDRRASSRSLVEKRTS